MMRHEIYKKVRFCIASPKQGYVFDYPDQMEEDNVVDGDHTDDFFTETAGLPEEKGVYECDVDVEYWAPSYPDYDSDIKIVPIKIVKLL